MTVQMIVAEAKAELIKLRAAAQAGEDVIVVKDDVSAVQTGPVAASGVQLGLLEGEVPAASIPDYLEPISAGELADWEQA